MKIDLDSNQFTDIKISDVAPELHAITICDTTSYNFNVEKFHDLEVWKDPYILILIKKIGLNINLTEKLFVQTIVYNGKSSQNYYQQVCDYMKILNQIHKCRCIKSAVLGGFLVHIFPHSDQNNSEYENILRSVHIPSDPDSLFKKLKRVHFQTRSSLWKNALKATLLSLNIERYGWKVKRNQRKMRGNYNGALIKFIGNQLPPSMVKRNENVLNKKVKTKNETKYLKQKQKSP